MAFTIASVSEVEQRRNVLRDRKADFRKLQLRIDFWRNRLKKYLESDIWHDVPENAHRWTIVSDFPAAVSMAYVAMLSSERPQVTTQPQRHYSQQAEANADYSEEIGAAVFDTLNLHRSKTIEAQVAGYATDRGELVAKIISLSPEERGEVRQAREVYQNPLLPAQPEPDVQDYDILIDGDFPVRYELLDPMDCAWQTNTRGQLTEFVHAYTATWDELCGEFEELYDHKDFKNKVGKVSTANEQVEVIDYWNMAPTGPMNSITISGKWFKKPTLATDGNGAALPWIPIVVEEVNAKTVPMDGSGTRKMVRGQPALEMIIDDAAEESWLRSLSRSYIEQIPFQTVVVTGFDTLDPRNFLKMRSDLQGSSRVDMVIDNAPGGKFVFLPPGMDIHFMQLPEIVPTLENMKQTVNQSMQNLTMPLAVLSGQVPSETSGYAYYQMKQIPMAKVGPYELGCNRFLSRSMEMILAMLVMDWDRIDTPLVLSKLTGQTNEAAAQLSVTKEQFAAIGSVQVRMKVAVPSNKEQEDAAIIQMKQTGLMSPETAIDQLGYVQNAYKEWQQAMAQQWIEADPQSKASVAADYLQNKGITQLQPVPPPVAPQGGPVGSSPMGGPVPQPMPAPPPAPGPGGFPPPGLMAPPGAGPGMMPAGPMPPEMAMAGGPPMGPNGGPPPNIPPEVLQAILAQMQQGGG